MDKCYSLHIGAIESAEHSKTQSRQKEDGNRTMRNLQNGNPYRVRMAQEAQSSLYRSQNKSIVVTMVWLIGITALVLGVVVMASELGLF